MGHDKESVGEGGSSGHVSPRGLGGSSTSGAKDSSSFGKDQVVLRWFRNSLARKLIGKYGEVGWEAPLILNLPSIISFTCLCKYILHNSGGARHDG